MADLNSALMAMASQNQGAVNTTAVAAAASAVAIKAGPGRLVSVLVTTLGTAGLTFQDGLTATGTVIGSLPASAAVGTVYRFDMPAAVGIFCNAGTNTPAVTVGWT